MLSRILIANRGEIARRVNRTAHAMGIQTVAVFSDPDENAPFVREADESVPLGGAAPADTYLSGSKILQAARTTGCDSVHPGYGFLAENAGFARSCQEAGLVFIGPSPDVIATMASKTAARAVMSSAGVPLLPAQTVKPKGLRDHEQLLGDARVIGYPLLVKAEFGGGGRGMRVVEREDALLDAVESAERESAAAFGEGAVFMERFLESPRHIEIQVIGDRDGRLVHLFERECSIQRRYQKLVEEAPSPALDASLRAEMAEVAVAGAKALGYEGAGTVEFVVDPAGNFYFLEVNTRIQVEHPVTEAVTGLDIVELQIRVASGEGLSEDVLSAQLSGHAIEVRLYAEDVAAGYLPASGPIHRLSIPQGPGIRVEAGYEDGSSVSASYDAMLAKVIAWAPDRAEAARRLATTLRRARIHGPTTNRDLLVAVLEDPDFLAGRTDTGLLERAVVPRLGLIASNNERRRLHAAVAALAGQADRRRQAAVQGSIPSGWRNVPTAPQSVYFEDDLGRIEVRYRFARDATSVEVDGDELPGLQLWSVTPEAVDLSCRGARRRFDVSSAGSSWYVDSMLGSSQLREVDRFPLPTSWVAPGSLLAPLPGTVTRVLAVPGERVSAGEPLVVIEAMKMQHEIRAPRHGVVSEVTVGVSDQVETGALLVVVTEEPAATGQTDA